MGTIIRTALAFNYDAVVLSKNCVDIYNPKVLRATMGSIFRVKIYEKDDLESYIKELVIVIIETWSCQALQTEIHSNQLCPYPHFSP